MSFSPNSDNPQQKADFEALYKRLHREVWALAYARWMNADLALEIMQEAFMRLWKKWREGAEILNPRAWLLCVTRNLAEDSGKSAFRRNGTQAPDTMNGISSNAALPVDWLEREETFHLIRREMEELSDADREILTLRYGLDYHANKIAELLEINTTAVHMRLCRARQRLAERLDEIGVDKLP